MAASDLPLADAARRLRGKPGRPRTRPAPCHGPRHGASQVVVATEPVGRPQDQQSGERARVGHRPRLLGLKDAAAYLGVSDWTVRALVKLGHLHPVRLPGVCRTLFDVQALDRLVSEGSR
jgi:excisionase family DNA binding protein